MRPVCWTWKVLPLMISLLHQLLRKTRKLWKSTKNTIFEMPYHSYKFEFRIFELSKLYFFLNFRIFCLFFSKKLEKRRTYYDVQIFPNSETFCWILDMLKPFWKSSFFWFQQIFAFWKFRCISRFFEISKLASEKLYFQRISCFEYSSNLHVVDTFYSK